MKRLLLIGGLLLGSLVAGVAGLAAVTFLGRQSIPDSFEVAGVRVVKDGYVSVGVLAAESGEVALIDAGNDRAGTAILAELSRRGLEPGRVTTILLTHGHPDHQAAVGLFPNARVMALAAEVPLVTGRATGRGPLPRLLPFHPTGVTVARALTDGEVIALGPTRVHVFSVPGHTAGSAAYLVSGVLFLGDAADASSSGEVIGAPWVFSDSQSDDRASLVRLADRLQREGADIQAIVFSHSGVLTGGLQPLTRFATRRH